MLSIVFILLSSVIFISAFWMANIKMRIIAGLWSLIYFVTTGTAAIYLGLPNGVFRALNYKYIEDQKLLMFDYDFKYWVLVFGPFLTLGLAMLTVTFLFKIKFFQRLRGKISLKISKLIKKFPLSFTPIIIISLVATTATTIYALNKGFSLSPFSFLKDSGNYDLIVKERYNYFAIFTYRFWGILYTLLPALTIFSIYSAFKDRRHFIFKLTLSVMLGGFLIYFNFMSFQKLPAMVVTLFIGLTILYLSKIKLRYYIIFIALGGIFFLSYQLLSVNELSLNNVVKTLAFRSGVNPAYYCNIYPEIIPFERIDLCYLNRFGVGQISLAPIHVHGFAFPEVKTVGFMPGAFHIAAYAEAGIIYSMILSFLIFMGILVAVNFIKPQRSIYDFGIFFSLAWFSYYLTQVQLRDAAFGSYGIQWIFLAVIIIVFVAMINYGLKLFKGKNG